MGILYMTSAGIAEAVVFERFRDARDFSEPQGPVQRKRSAIRVEGMRLRRAVRAADSKRAIRTHERPPPSAVFKSTAFTNKYNNLRSIIFHTTRIS